MTSPFNVFTATGCDILSLSLNNPRYTIPNSPIEYYIHTGIQFLATYLVQWFLTVLFALWK